MSYPGDILRWPHVIHMRYCRELSHPDDILIKFRYVTKMTWVTPHVIRMAYCSNPKSSRWDFIMKLVILMSCCSTVVMTPRWLQIVLILHSSLVLSMYSKRWSCRPFETPWLSRVITVMSYRVTLKDHRYFHGIKISGNGKAVTCHLFQHQRHFQNFMRSQ